MTLTGDEDSGLPAGWATCSIADVTLPVSKIDPKDDPDRVILYIDISGIDNARNVVGSTKTYRLGAAPSRARQIVRSGDVLFATVRPYLRNIAVVPSSYDQEIASTGFAVLRPAPGVNPAFLFYLTTSASFVNALSGLQYGVSYPAVTDEQVRTRLMPLPPTREQARIVEKIEELFSELANGVESLNIACQQLAAYRLATLDAATTGQLLVNRGLRDASFSTTEATTLSSVVESLDQGWSPRCLTHSSPSDDVWCVMKTTAIQPAEFRENENKELPASLEPRPHLSIRKGDVLVTRAGPRNRVGVACLVRSSRPRLMLCDKAYRLRANRDEILPEYLEIVLNAPRTIDQIETLKTGISDSGVNLTQHRFLSLDIYVPSLTEQEVTIAEVESVLSNVSHTRRQVDDTIARASLLRQAILESAFEGRLVDQDPHDEPASVLFQRIASDSGQAAQQNGAPKAGRRRRTGT